MNIKSPAKYVMNQTMLRIADPVRSVKFYQAVLGITLLDRYDFEHMRFSLYFKGYPAGAIPTDEALRVQWVFEQQALLELTHNWRTQGDAPISYHNGNSEPRGFGHIGISVPDVHAACARFESLGVEFVKHPDQGSIKGLAFIKGPDGYWIEVLSSVGLREVVMNERHRKAQA